MNTPRADKKGGVIVKRFNPYEIYSLGKSLFPILEFENKDYQYSDLVFPLFFARSVLTTQVQNESVFQPASRRASEAVIKAISNIVPPDIQTMVNVDRTTTIDQVNIYTLKDSIQKFETVLTNDMPGVAAYVVSKKGIYDTEELVAHADNIFPEEIRNSIPERAKKDIVEAGKCLAFEVPTEPPRVSRRLFGLS